MKDLANERLAVIQRLSDLYLEPVNAEGWVPNGQKSWPRIQSEIESSDLFVLISGERYGWIPDTGPGAGAGLSVTHLEYREARRLQIPVLPFLKQLFYDTDRLSDDAKMRDQFRREVMDWSGGHFVAEFELAPDLAAKVGQSLIELLTDEFQAKRIKVRSTAADSIRFTETQKEILRVLAENNGSYLRRKDIHERLVSKEKPTPARVGQVLAELFYEGLLQRVHGPAQGNPYASFYTLSSRGLEVYQDLRLQQDAQEINAEVAGSAAELIPHRVKELVRIVLDPAESEGFRGIALGALASSPIPGEQVLEFLEAEAKQRRGEEMLLLFKRAFREIVLAKSRTEAAREDESSRAVSPIDTAVINLSLPPQFVVAQRIVSMATRRDWREPLLRRDILSAQEEAAAEALISYL